MFGQYDLLVVAGIFLAIACLTILVRMPRVGKTTKIGYILHDRRAYLYKRKNGDFCTRIGERRQAKVVRAKIKPKPDDEHEKEIWCFDPNTTRFDPMEKVLIIR